MISITLTSNIDNSKKELPISKKLYLHYCCEDATTLEEWHLKFDKLLKKQYPKFYTEFNKHELLDQLFNYRKNYGYWIYVV